MHSRLVLQKNFFRKKTLWPIFMDEVFLRGLKATESLRGDSLLATT